ncbi:MAG: helicase HerA-like domain-containing protein [Candidatus Binatia bacterium]
MRGQLGHRIQHTLRACTPQHQKAVRAAAGTFRANPQLDVATAITELGVGETLVSLLDEAGTRIPVQRAVHAPRSQMAPRSPAERRRVVGGRRVCGHCAASVDRASAYERRAQPNARDPRSTASSAKRRCRSAPVWRAASARRSCCSLVPGVLGAMCGGRPPLKTAERITAAATRPSPAARRC